MPSVSRPSIRSMQGYVGGAGFGVTIGARQTAWADLLRHQRSPRSWAMAGERSTLIWTTTGRCTPPMLERHGGPQDVCPLKAIVALAGSAHLPGRSSSAAVGLSRPRWRTFESIAGLRGFYFGRFDVRVDGSLEAFRSGQGFKIIGSTVSSEATHLSRVRR